MTIKSGQLYKIANEENGLVFDLAPWRWYPRRDGRSIHGWRFHGGKNQQVNQLRYFYIRLIQPRDTVQWITERQDDGQWTIRTVEPQMYLGFKVGNTLYDGTLLDGLDKPQLWEVEVLPESEDHDNPRVRYV